MNIKYPKGEIVWVSYYNTEHELQYIITSKPVRDFYFIYKYENGDFKKLGRSKSPVELEEKFIAQR